MAYFICFVVGAGLGAWLMWQIKCKNC